MNKLISTKKNRIFISLVGSNDSDKTYLIHEWLNFRTFQPKFDKIYFFCQHPQPLYDVMQKEIDNLQFLQGVHFKFISSLKNNGAKYLLIFDDSCAETQSPRSLWTILPLADIADFVLYTLNTTYSTKVNQEGMLSCKTHTLFFSSTLEMCIKLLH